MGQRQQINLNKGWQFTHDYEAVNNDLIDIDLPHTWNSKDVADGNLNYYRGTGIYVKKIDIQEEWKDKRLFLRFLGANTVANVFVNGQHVGEHRGGYTAFAFEITSFLEYGSENNITVWVNNAKQLDVMPLVGDFNIYGGLFRDVELYVTNQDCISLLDFGSKGVYIHQQEVTTDKAEIAITAKILTKNAATVNVKIQNSSGEILLEKAKPISEETDEVIIPITLSNPHLWNGVKDPYLYKITTQLLIEDSVIDEVVQHTGFRYVNVDPNKGVFLNGEHIQVKGVCRHQDQFEMRSALSKEQNEEDVVILKEMGANAIRLSHYPQDPYLYDLLDEKGIICWSEIPFVGRGGFGGSGYIELDRFKENGKQQLTEMIRQNINHPSILFWGLFNELKERKDSPIPYLKELNELAHSEDPSRLTTCASYKDGAINSITDLVTWNKYDGWYGGDIAGLGIWADKKHEKLPNTPIGLGEYGAGASLLQQSEELAKPVANSYWHPENWQTYFHEEYWKMIDERPYLWGSFIWALFDFGSAYRTEGDTPGINDKGLVSYDRKLKKDAFYFYKANWNKNEPMVYITERRLEKRSKQQQTIKVYSNQRKVSLFVNGKKYKATKGEYGSFYFDVELALGENRILAKSGEQIKDEITLIYDKSDKKL